jgi:hypothetical protein
MRVRAVGNKRLTVASLLEPAKRCRLPEKPSRHAAHGQPLSRLRDRDRPRVSPDGSQLVWSRRYVDKMKDNFESALG